MATPRLSSRIGTTVLTSTVAETVRAYIPKPLPPHPPLDLARLLAPIERANQALGRLDGMTSILPSTHLFVFMYVRKEALLSSQIEGTQSSLSDLLLFESEEVPFVPLDDVQEVSNYIAAMDHGLKRLAKGFPLSLRLIKEMHRALLSRGRGDSKQPGEFRKSQNWIGGTRPGNAAFVPPPPDRLMECLGDLEEFLHDRKTYPVLIRAALAHVQFETIHPFLDGNGRLGRLLINRSGQKAIGKAGLNSFSRALRKPLSRASLRRVDCSSSSRTTKARLRPSGAQPPQPCAFMPNSNDPPCLPCLWPPRSSPSPSPPFKNRLTT